MLSIIICSIKENLFQSLYNNIRETIGNIPYEIIRIDNNKEKLSITKAYNKGASQAQYPNLLFIHEDVSFDTMGWGSILCENLNKNSEVGVIGLAGSKKKFSIPTGVASGCEGNDFLYVNHRGIPKIVISLDEPELKPIKVIDGVFLACRRDVWEEVKFNNKLEGFHCYDLDFSIRVSEKYQNYLITKISLWHFSEGNFNNQWIEKTLKFHKKRLNFDIPTQDELYQSQNYWMKSLEKSDISFLNRLRYIYALKTQKKLSKNNIKFLLSNNNLFQKIKTILR